MAKHSSILHFIDKLKLYLAGGPPEPLQIDHSQLNIKYYISDLINRATANFMIKYFNGTIGHEVDLNRGFLGFGLMHYSFISLIRPKRILCIGSQKGFIPAICAMACKDNNFGHVDFVDAGKNSFDRNSWGGTGFWKKHDPDKHFFPYNLNRFITTYVMTSKSFSSKYVKRRYGYIYIDGDHSYEGVKNDYLSFWPKLIKHGIMSFHDITLTGIHEESKFGVYRLWKEISRNSSVSIISRQNGIGFLQKNN
jgi:hypothetical protein